VVSDPIEKSDAIVVLGGGVPHRAMEAARLYTQGWASEVWVTRPPDPAIDDPMVELGIKRPLGADYSRQILEAMGVPDESIRWISNRTRDTGGEVGAIARMLVQTGGERVVIVTSPFHARRVRTIWRRVVGEDFDAHIRPAADDPFDSAHWWRNTADTRSVVNELMGLVNAWSGFRIGPR
jgi:uncharacterized SAM-binding protein YcdF (DUF218 family)